MLRAQNLGLLLGTFCLAHVQYKVVTAAVIVVKILNSGSQNLCSHETAILAFNDIVFRR